MSILSKLEARRTYKTIGDLNEPVLSSEISSQRIDRIIASAGNAPLHYACDRSHRNVDDRQNNSLNSSVPWRAYKLDAVSCNGLMDFLIDSGDATKVPNMLAAAEYLVQVTWLPDEGTLFNRDAGKDETAFVGTLRNMEHVAAASAFVQSLLLAGEEQGFKTYWSSGGALKSAAVFEYLKIPLNQLLIGSIFLFPSEPRNAEVKPGTMKDARGDLADWSKWCSTD